MRCSMAAVAWKSRPGKLDYYSSYFIGREEIKINDCVAFPATGPDALPHIGKVRDIWRERATGRPFVRVRWFFRPEEVQLKEGSPNILDRYANELFLAGGLGPGAEDKVDLYAISRKAIVLCLASHPQNPLPKYLDISRADAVFRRIYDATANTLNSVDEALVDMPAEAMFNKPEWFSHLSAHIERQQAEGITVTNEVVVGNRRPASYTQLLLQESGEGEQFCSAQKREDGCKSNPREVGVQSEKTDSGLGKLAHSVENRDLRGNDLSKGIAECEIGPTPIGVRKNGEDQFSGPPEHEHEHGHATLELRAERAHALTRVGSGDGCIAEHLHGREAEDSARKRFALGRDGQALQVTEPVDRFVVGSASPGKKNVAVHSPRPSAADEDESVKEIQLKRTSSETTKNAVDLVISGGNDNERAVSCKEGGVSQPSVKKVQNIETVKPTSETDATQKGRSVEAAAQKNRQSMTGPILGRILENQAYRADSFVQEKEKGGSFSARKGTSNMPGNRSEENQSVPIEKPNLIVVKPKEKKRKANEIPETCRPSSKANDKFKVPRALPASNLDSNYKETPKPKEAVVGEGSPVVDIAVPKARGDGDKSVAAKLEKSSGSKKRDRESDKEAVQRRTPSLQPSDAKAAEVKARMRDVWGPPTPNNKGRGKGELGAAALGGKMDRHVDDGATTTHGLSHREAPTPAGQKGLRVKTREVESCGMRDGAGAAEEPMTVPKLVFKRTWADKVALALKQRRVLVLDNLDPSLTSRDLEVKLKHVLPSVSGARMVPCYSVNLGKAVVIMESNEALELALNLLAQKCLVYGPNLRPVVAREAQAPPVRTEASFPGHMEDTRHRFGRQARAGDHRKGVVCSHSSQPNTIEYDMAIAWRVLEQRQALEMEALLKAQAEEMLAAEKQMGGEQ